MNNIHHSIEEISTSEFFPLLETFLQKMDLPTNDGFNNFLVSHLAKKNNSNIIVSGIGGDELFFGYPSFSLIPKINKGLAFFPKSNLLNVFFRKSIYPILKRSFLKTKYAGIYEYGKNVSSAFLLIRSLFLPFEMENMLSPEIEKVISYVFSDEALAGTNVFAAMRKANRTLKNGVNIKLYFII